MTSDSFNVLIIDDDVEICFMIKAILNFKGYVASVCSNGNEVLNIVEANTPNLIIMDMLLSGTDGRQICKKLKSAIATKDIPVLMISAHPDAEITCKAAGADEFLSKPFEIEDLLGKVREFMDKSVIV
jgi:DNA-binding response OmpR family regulator